MPQGCRVACCRTSDDKGIVIGQKLAETLETGIGKRLVVMSQDPDNAIADRGFRVVGLFAAATDALEERFVFVGKHTAQRMLGIGDEITEVVFFGDSYRDVETTYAKVLRGAGDDLAVHRWDDIDTYLGTMLSFMDGFVLIWVVIIFMALSFGLVNTLVMAVFERVREIGLLLALGMRPTGILVQIVIEAVMLLAIGLAIGNGLAWLTIQPLEDGIDISVVGKGMEMMGAGSMLYPSLYARDMLLATVVVLLLGVVASLSPAWRASRLKPVEAITKAN